jgi:hypothetical protein
MEEVDLTIADDEEIPEAGCVSERGNWYATLDNETLIKVAAKFGKLGLRCTFIWCLAELDPG